MQSALVTWSCGKLKGSTKIGLYFPDILVDSRVGASCIIGRLAGVHIDNRGVLVEHCVVVMISWGFT